jgi:hypothetical protein
LALLEDQEDQDKEDDGRNGEQDPGHKACLAKTEPQFKVLKDPPRPDKELLRVL